MAASAKLLMCRLCAETDRTAVLVDIEEIGISPMFIQQCLPIALASYPFEIPKQICKMCATKLQCWYTFVHKVGRINYLITQLEENGRPFTENAIVWIQKKLELEFSNKENEKSLLSETLKPVVEIAVSDAMESDNGVKSTNDCLKLSHSFRKSSVIVTNNSFIIFKCHLCEDTFQNWCALGNHTGRQHSQKPRVLCLCNQYLYTRAAINRHIAKHDTNSHISCPKCGKVCLSEKYLRAHILSHNSDENPGHTCDECRRFFSSISYLKVHKKTHLPAHRKYTFACTICKKKLTTKSAWKNHISSVHEKMKPYICDKCGQTFAHKTNLAYHIRSHGHILAYPCTICPKRFKNKGKLSRHAQTHSSKNYPCTVCAKLLKSQRTLRVHMQTHLGQQRFICHICQKVYKREMSFRVDYLDKYTFLCDWYEEDADAIRELCLHLFPFDNTVQIVDVNRKRRFVNRVLCPGLRPEMLQMGATIRMFSRLLYIKSCAHSTRSQLFGNLQRTFALIKPMPASEFGKIFTFVQKNGFQIIRLKKTKLDKEFALLMYRSISNHPELPIIIDYVTSGEVVGLELVAASAVKKWRDCIGVREPANAAPGTLRRMYGESTVRNIVHGTDEGEVNDCINNFFGPMKLPLKAVLRNCSCCIIKPHALVDGNLGQIVDIITAAKFKIANMAMFSIETENAEEFYEVYKDVLPTFKDMAAQLSEGRCVAMEILGEDPDVDCVSVFRELCGPREPAVCRQLYPDTLRARFGRDVVHNAVHCTDLPEDGVLEVEYFFKLLL